jgi:hypothetical protein
MLGPLGLTHLQIEAAALHRIDGDQFAGHIL